MFATQIGEQNLIMADEQIVGNDGAGTKLSRLFPGLPASSGLHDDRLPLNPGLYTLRLAANRVPSSL